MLVGGFAAALWTVFVMPTMARELRDDIPRTAVVSAFAPELNRLKADVVGASEKSANGVAFTTGTLEGQKVVLFLSGISVVNAAMTTQLALDRFSIKRIIFSGIAGGVDPDLRIGDVVIADRWGQYLEMVFARKVGKGWAKPPFFKYPYANFGMMFPRTIKVPRAGINQPEDRFWFSVDRMLLSAARRAANGVTLARCTVEKRCLDRLPRIVIGGPGVSGSAFVDNTAFRTYVFRTFGARVIDMESGAVAHVAYANDVPFIAVRSLADLAGGGEGANQMEIFLDLAAMNAAAVVKALLRAMSE